ncbi:trans-resveratrol di-O-methyltransferase-like [Arachis stenosperma]|uniref:trans-resveratrol di-O-methyltransferase-like n=1 Tax=Arachis stenosperma TaxID=217475 RepID=UPI0025ACDC33|nr:trans-resveratrol di-O-methyltransferase-like [Arachis stenosperma]
MEFQGGEQSDNAKLVKAQSHIWNHTFSFINSMSLKCAVELGIPDAIHNYGKPMPHSQLIASLPIHPSKTSFIHRLMRILIHSGIFVTEDVTNNNNEVEIGYVLTDSCIFLLKNNPFSVTTLILMNLGPTGTKPWHHLSDWFKNDDLTVFETAHGMTFWEYIDREPEYRKSFIDGMASDARVVSSLLLDDKWKGVFEGLESVVDVGGGTGTVAKAIAESFPKLKCSVFDLPCVVDGLQGTDNLKYIAGDMFVDPIPPSHAILLKWILHDWNDEECVKILKRCKEAIMHEDKGGKVVIIDMVVEDDNKKDYDRSLESQLFSDMLMMVLFSGKERNKIEWTNLIFSAGFTRYKITPIHGLMSLIEIYP